MSYDFSTLSPTDFEELVADLLSAEWKTRLESFKPGKDGGIDLLNSRRPVGKPKTVIQCKRYGPDKFDQLLRSMREERKKLEKLKPDEYILVTSVPLSNANKVKLQAELHPYCSTSGSIYGAQEVNALLRSFPHVERAHFKLWISSTAVLQRVLHARIFAITDATIEATRHELRKLVPHKGLDRALDILKERHHVLIVGNPGIGKTTLARMLLCHYIRDKFEPVCVGGNIDDAWAIVHSAEEAKNKLAIVYDDFLGQLEFSSTRFQKNEDSSLFLLLDKVAKSDHLRLILTTREYILEDARRVHGVFASRANDLLKCTLSLEDYSDATRARVLFNHLYFSDLPDSRIFKLLQTKVYRKIVNHRHFNPRVVENISKHSNSQHLDDNGFIQFIEHEFANPAKLWEHPFTQEISQISRQFLVALWSFERPADVLELQKTLADLNPGMAPEQLSQQFKESQQQLEGNFTQTDRLPEPWKPEDRRFMLVQFQNPSVQEFVGSVVADTPAWLTRLAPILQSMDQVRQLMNAAEKMDPLKVDQDFWAALRVSAKRVESLPRKYVMHCADGAEQRSYPAWFIKKALTVRVVEQLLRLESLGKISDARTIEVENRVLLVGGWSAFLNEVITDYDGGWAIVSLMKMIRKALTPMKQEQASQAYEKALFTLLNSYPDVNLSNLDNMIEALVIANQEHLHKLRPAVDSALATRLRTLEDEESADQLHEEASSLENISKLLDADFTFEVGQLRALADELEESAGDSSENSEPDISHYITEDRTPFDIDTMFSGLTDRHA